MPSRLTVMASVATLWLLGGVVYPLLTIASEELSAVQVTALRTTGALLMTTPLLLLRARGQLRALLGRATLWPNVVAGVLFYPLGNGLLTYASARLPSAISALVFSMLPVVAAVVASLRGQRLGAGTWAGITGAVVGMLMLAGAPTESLSLLGLLAALASVACWFVGTDYWSTRGVHADVIASVWVQLLIGTVGCWVLLVVSQNAVPRPSVAFQPVMIVLALSQFVAHMAYLGVAGRVSHVLLTSFAFVNPVVAALAGFVLLGQHMTLVQAGASVVLLAAVALVARPSTPDAG